MTNNVYAIILGERRDGMCIPEEVHPTVFQSPIDAIQELRRTFQAALDESGEDTALCSEEDVDLTVVEGTEELTASWHVFDDVAWIETLRLQ